MTSSPPTPTTPTGWKQVAKPASLFCRFEFANYSETRAFLDALAEISEETGLFPDLGFGTSHVNVTIHCANGTAADLAETEFARRASSLEGTNDA